MCRSVVVLLLALPALPLPFGDPLGQRAHAQQFADSSHEKGPQFLLASNADLIPVDVARTPLLGERISLEMDGVTLKDALAEITRQSGLHLVYSDDVLPEESSVRLRAHGITLAAALTDVLFDAGVDVVFSPNGSATLVKRPPQPVVESEEAAVPAGSIVGRVTEAETGVGVRGASVLVEGTGFSAVTGNTGRYRITDVPAGTYRAVAQQVGYEEAGKSVTVSDGGEATVNFAIEVSALPMDEIVVTGSVTETRIRELPSPISVITAAEIERKNVSRLDDLLRGAIPGLIAFDNGGTDNYFTAMSVRGANSLTGSSYFKIYIDGVEAADPRYLGVLDPAIVDRIEMVRGPQASTMYGSEASNGVLQIFTKKGHDTGLDRPRIDASTSVGYINADYGLDDPPLVQKSSVQLSGGGDDFTYNVGGGYQYAGHWMTESATNVRSLFGGVRAMQGPFAAEVSLRYLRNVFDSPRDPVIDDLFGLNPQGIPTHQVNDQKQQTVALKLSYQPFPSWFHELTLGSDQQNYGYRLNEPRFATPADSLLYMLDTDWDKASIRYNTSLNVDFSNRLSADLLAGFDQTKYSSNSGFARGTTATAGTITSTSAELVQVEREVTRNRGYFVQGNVSLDDAFFLTGGVRVEDNPNIGGNGRFTAPRIGAAYARAVGPMEAKVRISWGESIKAPAVEQKAGSQTSTTIFLPNPQIAPEQQAGWDAGLELYFEGRASLAATYYNQTAKDLIDFVYVDVTQTPRKYQYQNIGTVDNQGWEFEGSLTLGPVDLQGNLTFASSDVADLGPDYTGDLTPGDRVRRIPENTASLSATLGILRGTVAMDVRYTGEWIEVDYLDYYGYVYGGEPYKGSFSAYFRAYEPFTILNVRVEQAISDQLSGFLKIDNVTDNQQSGYSNLAVTRGITPMVGLRFTY